MTSAIDTAVSAGQVEDDLQGRFAALNTTDEGPSREASSWNGGAVDPGQSVSNEQVVPGALSSPSESSLSLPGSLPSEMTALAAPLPSAARAAVHMLPRTSSATDTSTGTTGPPGHLRASVGLSHKDSFGRYHPPQPSSTLSSSSASSMNMNGQSNRVGSASLVSPGRRAARKFSGTGQEDEVLTEEIGDQSGATIGARNGGEEETRTTDTSFATTATDLYDVDSLSSSSGAARSKRKLSSGGPAPHPVPGARSASLQAHSSASSPEISPAVLAGSSSSFSIPSRSPFTQAHGLPGSNGGASDVPFPSASAAQASALRKIDTKGVSSSSSASLPTADRQAAWTVEPVGIAGSEGNEAQSAKGQSAARPTDPQRKTVRLPVPTLGQTEGEESVVNVAAITQRSSSKTSNPTVVASEHPASAPPTTTSTRAPAARRLSRLHAGRQGPQLPSAANVLPASPPAMYWSKVPVHGSVPRRSFRAHSACLADEVLWLFGGCDSKGCFRDLWCFDTETMCWSKPKATGDLPPPRRAHSATMVDKRLYVFAGGDGPYYFNDLYVLDTIALRWTKPDVFGQPPSPRRAHTSNYYNGQLIIFGGGNGVGALNDVYSLDISAWNRLEWRKIACTGNAPIGRGYHTSNLVDGKLIVIGGSDGHMSFNDIHILKLDTKVWYQVKTDEAHNRLGHTATQVGSYLFVVGGHDSHSYTPDILTLNLVNLQWEPRSVCGKKPPGRGYHQSWLRDSRLFVHGGFDGKEIYDDLYYIDLSACAYLPQITSFSVELDDE